MNATSMRYLLVAAGALIVGLLAAGTPLQTLLPILLLMACPIMMITMMHGMHGGHSEERSEHDHHDTTTRR